MGRIVPLFISNRINMMTIPTTTRDSYGPLPKVHGFHDLTLQEAIIRPLKSSEVLIKVHAVSLQNIAT
ncbi:hypothetical protein A0H81_05552 [Grifola frondosa]|uniref:Uncharacterized protein n=1 Tax=Grifola frondosa TaxID=5627 RepID=A0A1C7MBL4_GRIFR|nr:hypothetical protein A0H81_05552 [Grifola frondosa]